MVYLSLCPHPAGSVIPGTILIDGVRKSTRKRKNPFASTEYVPVPKLATDNLSEGEDEEEAWVSLFHSDGPLFRISMTGQLSGVVQVPHRCPGQLSGVVQVPRRCPGQLSQVAQKLVY